VKRKKEQEEMGKGKMGMKKRGRIEKSKQDRKEEQIEKGMRRKWERKKEEQEEMGKWKKRNNKR